MKKISAWLSIALLIGLVMLFAGCSGGGGNSLTVGIPLTVGADLTPGGLGLTRGTIAINAPLDAGASVQAIDFRTGEVVATGSIGEDGTTTITVPAGLTVAIVITGTSGGKDYRMSTIIPVVPNVPEMYILTPETTLAAEALAAEHPNQAIDQATFDAVANAAGAYLSDNPTADISLGGGILNTGSTFGGSSALNAEEVAAIINEAAKPLNSNLALAKNGVQQIKEAWMPLSVIAQDELPSVVNAFSSVSEAVGNVDLSTVIAKYELLGDRMNQLLIPSMSGKLMFDGSPVDIMDLTVGRKYIVTISDGPFGPEYLVADNGTGTDGQVTLILDDIVTLTAKKNAGNWVLNQTSTSDPDMDYTVSFPDLDALDPEATTISLNAHVSLEDDEITVPLVFNGTLTITSLMISQSLHIIANGTLTSDVLTSTGAFDATFPIEELSRGTRATFELPTLGPPTSFTMTGASLHFTADDVDLLVQGSIATKLSEIEALDGSSDVIPTEFSLTGGKISFEVGGNSISIEAAITVKGSPIIKQYSVDFVPTSISLKNTGITVVTPATTITLSGDISAGAKIISGTDEVIPTSVTLHGGYTNSETTLVFDGTLTGTCTNTQVITNDHEVKGTLSLLGSLTTNGRIAYDIDGRFASDGAGNISNTINNIQWGGSTLTGSASIVIPVSGDIQTASLDLTNQDGVKFHLGIVAGVPEGKITVGTEDVATLTIGPLPGEIDILYTDSTTDSVFLFPNM